MKFQRSRMGIWAAVAGCALASIALAPAIAQDAGPFSWTYAFEKKQTTRYNVNVTVTGKQPDSGEEFKVAMKSREKQDVFNVNDKGEATIVVTVEQNSTNLNGQTIQDDPTTLPVVTRVVNRDGVIVSHDVANAGSSSRMLLDLSSLLRNTPTPKTPVKLADSWQNSFDNPFVPDAQVTLNSTLAAKETIDGVDTYKVRTDMKVPMSATADKDTASISGSYNVDPKNGRLIRMSIVADNVTMATPDPKVSLKVKLTFDMVLTTDKPDAATAAPK